VKYKQYITFGLFILISITGDAQITLDNSDFPLAGVKYGSYWGIGQTIGQAGPNQNYNFTNGYYFLADTLQYVNASQTFFGPYHPTSSIATRIKDQNFITIKYYNFSANAFWQSGITLIGDFGNGIDTIHGNYVPGATDTVLNDQYTYGYSDVDSSLQIIQFDANITIRLNYLTLINIDGYGSLSTPLNYFSDALRIKRIIYEKDSIFAGNIFIQESRDTLYEYWYYAKNVRHPVVIAHTNALDTIQYVELINIPPIIFGCTDPQALNYNPMATADDSSCYYCDPISYTITPDQDICVGDSIILMVNGGVNWLWNNGDVANSITVQPDSDAVYSVFIYDSAGCTEQASVQVKVHHPVSAAFWVNPAHLNTTDSIPFVNLSQNATSWYWDFDDNINGTSTLQNPYHHYSVIGLKTVMLAASNYCFSDTTYQTLNIVLGVEDVINIAESFLVHPNPGNIDAEISFHLNAFVPVELSVIDMLGNSKVLFSNTSAEGNYRYKIKSIMKEMPSGIYILVLKAGNQIYHKQWIKTK